LANLPLAPKLISVIVDRCSLQRFQRDDDKLTGRLLFKIGQSFGQRRARCRIKQASLIDDAPGERRIAERLRGSSPDQADPRDYDEGRAAGPGAVT
jgi:hypothetical protein